VVSEGAETHEWWSLAWKPPRPQRTRTITSVFLLPQKSHECRFIFIPCHKNYRKTIFNYGIPHAKFVMTLRRRSYDITSTCPTMRMTSLRIPDDTDATEEIRITHMLYLIFLYHARIPQLDRDDDNDDENLYRAIFYWTIFYLPIIEIPPWPTLQKNYSQIFSLSESLVHAQWMIKTI
jgi:hypothetical protein